METHVHLTSPQDVQYQPGPVCALEILHRRDGNIDLSGPSIEDPLKWARKPLPKDCIGGLRIM